MKRARELRLRRYAYRRLYYTGKKWLDALIWLERHGFL